MLDLFAVIILGLFVLWAVLTLEHLAREVRRANHRLAELRERLIELEGLAGEEESQRRWCTCCAECSCEITPTLGLVVPDDLPLPAPLPDPPVQCDCQRCSDRRAQITAP